MLDGDEVIIRNAVRVDACGRMDRSNAAKALGKSQQTLSNWATAGVGPRPFKVAGRCYYWAEEVLAFGRGESAQAA
jgi:hypothetical protein